MGIEVPTNYSKSHILAKLSRVWIETFGNFVCAII